MKTSGIQIPQLKALENNNKPNINVNSYDYVFSARIRPEHLQVTILNILIVSVI